MATDNILEQIKSNFAALQQAMENGLTRAKEIGVLLLQKQAALVNTDAWEAWVTEACPFGVSSARNYVRIARQWDKIPNREEMSYSEAVKALAKKRRAVKTTTTTAKTLSPWTQLVALRMRDFKVKGDPEDVVKFLASFGVPPDDETAADVLLHDMPTEDEANENPAD